MPDIVMDYQRLYAWMTVSVWGYTLSGYAPLFKAFDMWALPTEDMFWQRAWGLTERNDFLFIRTDYKDVFTIIGSPALKLAGIDFDRALYIEAPTCEVYGVGFDDRALSDAEYYARVLGEKGWLVERMQSFTSFDDCYVFDFDTPASTADFKIRVRVGGEETILATESINLDAATPYKIKAEAVGSTLNFYRDDFTSPKISATDTTWSSGYGGLGRHSVSLNYARVFRKAYGSGRSFPRALAVLEVEMEEREEAGELAHAPALKRDLRGDRDLDAITYGGFELKPGRRGVVFVYGDNPHKPGAIQRQVEYAKSRGLRAWRAPGSYAEAVDLYRRLRSEFDYWVAGKDNFAFMALGAYPLLLFQVADTYYGNAVDGLKPGAYERVPESVMRSTLESYIESLKQVEPLGGERDKHIEKLRKVLKVGW